MKRTVLKGIGLALALFLFAGFPRAAAAPAGSAAGESTGQSEASGAEDRFMLITENEKLALYVHAASGNFSVKDKAAGLYWYAYPPSDREGLLRSFADSLRSLLDVSYSYEGNNLVTVGSYDEEDAMKIRVFRLSDGIRLLFEYDREDVSFSIPLTVRLRGDHIACEVDYGKIREGGGIQIARLIPLPNFGAADKSAEGYAFIPDGSGMIVHNADAASRNIFYEEPVYGGDPAQDLITGGLDQSLHIRMPVYGFARAGGACLAVIHEGTASSAVFASMQHDYLRCGASFVYREDDLTGISTKDKDTRILNMISANPVEASPALRYYFLSKEDADYSGMARRYRKYLEDEQGLVRAPQPEPSPLTIEAFGGAVKKSSFLGIPVKRLAKATSFEQLEAFQSQLQKAGINNTKWILYGFLKGGFENKQISSPQYERRLGGQRGYEKALESLGAENVFTVYDAGRRYGASASRLTAGKGIKSLNQTAVQRYYRKLSNGSRQEDFGLWTYRKIGVMNALAGKIIRSAPNQSGLVFSGAGEELYNDFSKNGGSSREELLEAYRDIYDKAAGRSLRTAAESGNLYLAAKAGLLYEIPLTGSGHSIESESVPFYSMVLHGFVPLASLPLNNRADAAEYHLRAFEQGVSALWRVTGCDPYELKDTKLNFLYNTSFEKIMEAENLELLQAYAETHARLAAQTIEKHRYEGALSVTTYESGSEIAVNYGENPVSFGGRTIEPGKWEVFS